MGMPDKPHEVWKLDLGKLSLSGCLLMLLTIATMIGVAIGMFFILESLGLGQKAGTRWVVGLALIAAIAAGSGVFLLGRQFFKWARIPILRSDEERTSDEHKGPC
jgi:hypothetical protein